MIAKGKILVSIPLSSCHKQNFVILIYQHDELGALGINLNCTLPQEFLFHLMDALNVPCYDPNPSIRIHYGGMYDLNQGLILHTNDFKTPSSMYINDELLLTNSVDLLKRIAVNDGPKKSLISLGHTRFTAGQVENEIYEHKWLVMKPDTHVIFTGGQVWHEAIMTKGLNPAQFQMSEHVGHA